MIFRAAVTGDWQVPYHCPDALDVAQQIIRDFGPVDVLDFNGDIYDLLNLSRHPNLKTELNEHTAIEFQGEIERGTELVKEFVADIQPKSIHWKNGNHEWRLLRAIANADQTAKKILELKVVREAYSYPSLFRFNELPCPVRFAGEYPRGSWLHPSLPPDQNCWVEHGYVARKKSGFTASAIMEERMSSCIVGHCHRAALIWRHLNGDRNFFAVEGAGLSLLGIPVLGDGMYQGVPHSVADYMNSTQGFTLVTYEDGRWWPELVRIHRGTAHWRGKLYVSRKRKRVKPR